MQQEAKRDGPRHRVPVIDRMVEILDVIADRPAGVTISEFVAVLQVPRTTVYRILNTLQDHGLIRRSGAGSYSLGPKLTHLAARVGSSDPGYDLAAIATPHLERLSASLGEGAKLSVVESGQVLVLAAVQGKRDYALAVKPGQRLPLHAGAAGKVLLAHLPDDALDAVLAGGAARFTPKTIGSRRRLLAELARIREKGWAEDMGEYMPSIQAFAAPIMGPGGDVVGALSVPYLAGAAPERRDEIRRVVVAAAEAVSRALPKGA